MADSNLCKCLKAIKCSESRVETLQTFFSSELFKNQFSTVEFSTFRIKTLQMKEFKRKFQKLFFYMLKVGLMYF